ncbi:LTA synthase family protein [Maribrevibacterium harenarium]|uniref:LTA synthase family protein n=1 Tax=Maribrevibacterium harenarium TaxID=2589817 RepID=A0A501WUG6_9GAMM|nr:LTA synthase family protein [Maribrevibacterium harenarium]TPE53373.1 LTA synthase family protein [Maribrevibacterium harenarium]
MYQQRMRLFIQSALPQLLWLVLMLLLARGMMFYLFTEPDQLNGKSGDIQRMWLTGLRYDLRVTSIFILLLFLPSLIFAAHRLTWRWWSKLLIILWPLLGFTFALSAIANIYYYQTYHNHFDMFVFALGEDDTLSVLANIWQDYPVIRIITISLLVTGGSYWLDRKVRLRDVAKPWHWALFSSFLIVVFLGLAILARGSLGTFPLRENDSHVSDLRIINKLTPNGLMTLSWAYDSKSKDLSFKPVKLSDGKRLQATLGLESLIETTPENSWLADNPPHVVMNLMESFGSNMLALDEADTNDMLGQLRPHFEQDFVFKRFVSEHNGTAPSFAALFFQSPMENISQSSVQNTRLDLIPFDVYHQSGYEVIFISPGNMAWRNFSGYLPSQGVDKVYDQNSLINLYPEAIDEITAWGVPDDYAYRLAETLLKEATHPVFITILTVTNHPPYITPERYQAYPVTLTEKVKAHLIDGDIGLENMLTTFQFAANAFGEFINKIKQSDLGRKTLIAATGDHQMRRLRATYPNEQVIDRAVPFYLYVPQPILDNTDWKYDMERVGSHKDIFPTIYHFSLSNAQYRSLAGRNMLATEDAPARAFGYNSTLWIDENGAYPLDSKVQFYPWAQAGDLELADKGQPPSPEQEAKLTALPQLLHWQINARVKGINAQ